MKLLINVYAVLEEKACSAMLEEVQDAVKSQLSDEGISKTSDLANCIYGKSEPARMIEVAKAWNINIRKELLDAMDAVKGSTVDGDIPLDTDHTFRLSLAARAADDHFTPCGQYGILADNGCGWPAFNVVLTPGQYRDIEKNPENWMVADIAVY